MARTRAARDLEHVVVGGAGRRVGLAAAAGVVPLALLLAAILAPTDLVLASEVQLRSEHDRDALRLSLSAEVR
jgi:NhaP-type Na+/H+ or K+/H+ antiporter